MGSGDRNATAQLNRLVTDQPCWLDHQTSTVKRDKRAGESLAPEAGWITPSDCRKTASDNRAVHTDQGHHQPPTAKPDLAIQADYSTYESVLIVGNSDETNLILWPDDEGKTSLNN